jgi:uncharacterized protein YdaU (DUF1376 family)
MHYYQFNIGDYSSHTKHLTPLEDICYRRLLDWYYLHEKPIPKDINTVTRMLILNGCSTEVEQVLNEFFVNSKNGWINPRADKEIDAYHNKILSSSRAGKISAEKRKTYNQQALNTTSTDVQPTNNHKPITNNHKTVKYIPPIPKELLDNWLIARKKKPVTKIVFDAISREAAVLGWSVEEAILYSCENSWQGFKAEWVSPADRNRKKLDDWLNEDSSSDDGFGYIKTIDVEGVPF